MDKIEAKNLKPGHRVKLSKPLPGRPDDEFATITESVQVHDGFVEPIYRINFKGSSWGLCCNASREFEVESSTPAVI